MRGASDKALLITLSIAAHDQQRGWLGAVESQSLGRSCQKEERVAKGVKVLQEPLQDVPASNKLTPVCGSPSTATGAPTSQERERVKERIMWRTSQIMEIIFNNCIEKPVEPVEQLAAIS